MTVSHEQRVRWIKMLLSWCHDEKITYTTPNAIERIRRRSMSMTILGPDANLKLAKQVIDLLRDPKLAQQLLDQEEKEGKK